MNVLVTGGAGYIGSHVSQKLVNLGYSVTILDNLSTGFKTAVSPNVEFIHGDVRDISLVSSVLKGKNFSGVMHFAAKLVVPESILKPIEYYENNVGGVMTVAKACDNAGVKNFIFSSTAAVYGSEPMGLISESTPTAPLNPYGQSKLMSETILKDCENAFGLRSVRLRYFNVAGAAQDGSNGQRTKTTTNLIKVASEAACGKRDFVEIYGTDYNTPDGTGIRDYIHVEDLADLHIMGLQYLEEGGASDTFNCGYGHGYSVKEVLEEIKKVSGNNFSVVNKPRRQGDAERSVADSAKVRKVFNWSPKRDDLAIICKSAYDWEKSLKT
ncbi:UDP-glucose 4-epimerase GalE [Bdellovibrio reynosensis]|uniref:UDP-glucose 4-epimerase n=1 Tax=Bdellovibrio reynosensis TaxID=2835041 RepID=A0ABY4CBY5_9BACT|nr:UDP-glucose 4-epimerase GalE [Bdellovibrio reynosensis]UOF02229.1 UDP-glucose 4-epimerase GalE [Bdellovibrio reynosensis]